MFRILQRRIDLQPFLLVTLVTIVTILSFWRVATFGFWRDDWNFLYVAQSAPLNLLQMTLHPATWLEDMLLFKLFGWNPIGWQVTGIILRIIASLTAILMMFTLSNSKKVAVTSGLLFASTPIGMQAAAWSSVHVVLIATTLICAGIHFWVRHLKVRGARNFIYSLLCISLAFLADPFRSLPLILIIILFEIENYCFSKQKEKIQKVAARLALICILATAVFLILPTNIKNSMYVGYPTLQNFFSSVGNLLVDLFYHGNIMPLIYMSNNSASLVMSTVFILVFSIFITIFFSIHKRSKVAFLLLTLIVWTIIFYLPGWLFYPQEIHNAPSRHFGISGIGLIGIMAIAIGLLRNNVLSIIVVALVIVLNIYTSNKLLLADSLLRSDKKVSSVWDQIYRDVAKNNNSKIFLYTADDYSNGNPLLHDVRYAVAVPFYLRGGRGRIIDTTNEDVVLYALCKGHALNLSEAAEQEIEQRVFYSIDTVSISELYAWNIGSNVVNTSTETRNKLKAKANSVGCFPKDFPQLREEQ